MKHILIFSQYFYPESFRVNDLAIELRKRGFKVSIVTGIPNYPEGKFFQGYGLQKKRRESWNDIDIYRIPIIPRGNNSVQLLLNYMSFVVSGKLQAYKLPKDFDVVLTYEVSPMTQALPAIWHAKKHKKNHFLYVMDLWPENVVAVTGLKNKGILSVINKMVDYIYNNTSKIFASSESFVQSIADRGVPEDKLIYWPQFAEDLYEPKDPDNNEVTLPDFTEKTFVFAGNIGEAQGLQILPKAAKILKDKKVKIKFIIIGDGRFKTKLVSMVEDFKVQDYFYFIDRQPAKKIPYYLAKCDVAMITLNDNEIFNKTIPAKLQSLMACGMPLLVSANGEVERIVSDTKTGLTSTAGDVEGLLDNLINFTKMEATQLDEMSKKSLAYHDEHFSKDRLIDKFIKVIEENTDNV